MALCERCGSIQVRATSTSNNFLDKLLTAFSPTRLFVCQRCGWRGRRSWTNDQLKSLDDYGFGGAQPDPSLTALDSFQSKKKPKRASKSSRQKRNSLPPVSLSQLDRAMDQQSLIEDTAGRQSLGADLPAPRRPRSLRTRQIHRRRTRSREILAAIALSALAVVIFTLIGWSQGCSTTPTGLIY